jgi:hypothetical protein
MAALIIKSLITGYSLVLLFYYFTTHFSMSLLGFGNNYFLILAIPFFMWQGTLLVSGIALIVYLFLKEPKDEQKE